MKIIDTLFLVAILAASFLIVAIGGLYHPNTLAGCVAKSLWGG